MESKSFLYKLRGNLFITVLFFYLLDVMISSSTISLLFQASSILLFLTTIIGVSKFYLSLTLAFICGSVVLTVSKGLSWMTIFQGFSSMAPFILFIGIVPLISSPIQGYVNSLKELIQQVRQKVSAFLVCHWTSFILSNFINLAALPISKTIFFYEGMEREKQNLNADLAIRSFGLAMLWTPIGAAIAMAIEITGSDWLSLLSINVTLVAIGLFLSYYLTKKKRVSFDEMPIREKINTDKPDFFILVKVFVPICFYFILLLMVDEFFTIGIMDTIVITVLPFTLIWCLVLKKSSEWLSSCKNQFFQQAPKLFSQFSVIMSAGLFIHTFEISGLDEWLFHVLPGAGNPYAAFWYIPISILLVLFLALLGVHQFVAMLLIGNMIHPHIFGIDSTIYASALLVGFVAGMLASAFSGSVILMSSFLPDSTPHQLGRRNYLFTFIFISISSLILVGANLVITS